MPVPTTTAHAPAPMAAAASAGVCTCPSQMMGSPGNSPVAWRSRSRSGPSSIVVWIAGLLWLSVVDTRSQPHATAFLMSSIVMQSAITRVSHCARRSRTVWANVRPSGLGRAVASMATTSAPAFTHAMA